MRMRKESFAAFRKVSWLDVFKPNSDSVMHEHELRVPRGDVHGLALAFTRTTDASAALMSTTQITSRCRIQFNFGNNVLCSSFTPSGLQALGDHGNIATLV